MRDLRRNAIDPSDISLIVYIDFAEDYATGFRLLRGELFKDWRNHFAWAAPVGVEVHDGVCRRRGSLLEVPCRADANHFGAHRDKVYAMRFVVGKVVSW